MVQVVVDVEEPFYIYSSVDQRCFLPLGNLLCQVGNPPQQGKTTVRKQVIEIQINTIYQLYVYTYTYDLGAHINKDNLVDDAVDSEDTDMFDACMVIKNDRRWFFHSSC